MIRRQLPVHSSIAARAWFGAAGAAFTHQTAPHDELRHALAERYEARAVTLTDSGTSALVLALRMALAEKTGSVVAVPAYACPDLLSAAVAAKARVRLYDTDPVTLSPDLGSVEHVLEQGARIIVVAHLYGYAADIIAVHAVAARHGAIVIEDAAQAAGGSLGSRRLGGYGPLTVLSFGRGKGVTGSGGGALLAIDERFAERVRALPMTWIAGTAVPAGWSNWAGALVQGSLGRPWVYGLPSALPFLHLGETRYHAPHEPRAMSRVSVHLLLDALERASDERRARSDVAEQWTKRLAGVDGLTPIQPVAGSRSGYLRFAVRDTRVRPLAPALGVVRGYPRGLDAYPVISSLMSASDAGEYPGSAALINTLITMPTHAYVTSRDLTKGAAWARVGL